MTSIPMPRSKCRPRDAVSTPPSPTQRPVPCRTPRLGPPRFLPYASPASSRRLPCAFAACYPRSSPDRHLPLRSRAALPVAPQNPRPRTGHMYRPRRIGRHQKRKTPLLYVARITHRLSSIAPCGLDLVSIRKGHFWI